MPTTVEINNNNSVSEDGNGEKYSFGCPGRYTIMNARPVNLKKNGGKIK